MQPIVINPTDRRDTTQDEESRMPILLVELSNRIVRCISPCFAWANRNTLQTSPQNAYIGLVFESYMGSERNRA